MATPASRLLKQLLLAVTTVTLLSIVCDAAATQTSSSAAGRERAAEMHGRKQQQQPTQQHYYDFNWKRNNSSDSNHNGIATPTAGNSVAEDAVGKSTRRSYNGFSAGGDASGGAEWRITYNGGSGSIGSSGSSGSGGSYNFGTAKLNDLTNLSGLRHISGGFGGGSASGAVTTAVAKQPIPIHEEQPENDFGASGEVGQTVGKRNQLGGVSSGWGYNSRSSAGSDALSTALYNLHAAGTHNDFLPSFGNKYSSGAASTAYSATPQYHQQLHQQLHQQQQSNDKISIGNFMHHYKPNSGGYGALLSAGAYAHQHQQLPTAAALHYFPEHDSQSSTHSGLDAAVASASSSGKEISFDHHGGDGGSDGDDGGHHEADSTGPSHDDASANYLPQPHHSEDEQQHHSAHHVVNYIPYPVVKKVHVPVREDVKIPVSHAVVMPVHKPVPIHIPVTKTKPVPVEKVLRVPVEHVVPFPVEKPVPVPVDKPVPFNVYKYVTVKVPHPFPVKVPVFKTILHKVKSKGW